MENSCEKLLTCLHSCCGFKDEEKCLPCLHEDCVKVDESKTMGCNIDSYCMICYTEGLG